MPIPHRARGPLRALLLTVAPALLLLSAPAAADTADPTHSGPATVGPQATYAEHYAGLLAEHPEGAAVVVDGAVGGLTPPEEMTDALHGTFASLGVPYHVVVTPFLGAGSDAGMDEILPAVHDRLGADGLYVILPPEGGVTELRAYGIDLSVDAGRDAVYAADVYGSPAHEVARVMVEGMADPSSVEAARDEEEPREGALSAFLDDIDPTRHNGPENLGFLVGAAGGAILCVGGWVAWRQGRRGRLVGSIVAVLVPLSLTGAAVASTYQWMMSAPVGGHEVADAEDLVRLEAPYVVSTGRVEAIAAHLAEEPLYVDPIMPLPREGLERVPGLLADAPVPVYAAVVTMNHHDEAEGHAEVLAAALASVAEEDGVYIVVGSGIIAPDVGAAAHGLEIDPYTLWSPMAFNEGATPAAALEQAVADVAEMEFTPGDGYEPLFADDEPHLPGPRGERYWSGGLVPALLIVGPFLAACAIGLTYLAVFLARVRAAGADLTIRSPRALRRVALRETGLLRGLLEREPDRIPTPFMAQAEAALMLMDRDPEGLDLLGVAVLARRVLAVADDPDAETEPCSVDPLHPFAVERARSRIGGGGRTPLCGACAELHDSEREKRMLRLRTRSTAHSYRRDPDTPWIRHRFGAHRPDQMVELLLKETRVH
ncbi:hypothetical protein PWG71_20915 [Nocardiopsis sp. N85]|uniref:hypothetical protein n=1 Tax=Nocardiopsis sp. N85 TaxID=3029400 RepID=UPI00237FC0AD|nr:hypothetical protein [Nocardiopsis sp. N85]MDE3723860.1 hypothetical protein [Nocardiopsis sp. N85]